MNSLPVTVQAIADTTRAAKSLENLTRKREVVLAATLDAKSIAAANKPLGAIKRSADEFEKSMQAANARVLAFGTSVAVIEGMRRSFLALIKTTADVEKSLTQIKVVANDELKAAGLSIEKVGNQIFDLAKKTGQSFDATSKSFLEFARQGLKPAQTLERTKTALELVRISGAEQEKVIGGLTAAYNAFSSSGLTFTKIAEKLVNVDNKTTTSVEGLVDVLSRASSTAKLTGTSFEELLAVTATLKDITARSESVIGNAYRSISARLIDPKVLENLEELGVRTREFDGGPLLKTIGILTNVGEKLKEISDPSLQTEIVKSISGLYQFDQLTALISALQDVNNLQGFYQKNLKASKEDSDALNKANEAFSNTLINKFNAVDVTIQQVLNSLGKIGVKNPLSSLLDGITELGEGFTKFIDGDSFGSDIAKAFIKGFGGVLLGPTGIVTVGFVIAKIIKDFGVFAFDAAKSFLSLNKTAKDQELIQKSILTTISQMPSLLNGIENTEQGRLLLAQRVSAEYERQLSLAATLNNIAKGAAQTVYGQGFRVTDKGLTKGKRSASGYLPDLISSEMRDVRSGVGGANPNSKIVVMPNFPFGGGKKGLMVANSSETAVKMGSGYGILNPEMMGKRAAEGDFPSSLSLANTAVALKSGKFAPIKKIEAALNQTVSSFLDLGNGTKGLYQEIQKTLSPFKLTGTTFKEVASAANDYAKELVKNKQAAKEAYEQQIILNNQKKKEQAEAARIQKLREESILKADQTIRSAPDKRAAFTPPIIVPSGGAFINRPSPREIENALKESSLKMIVEAADAVNQKIFDGILEKRKQIAEYIKKNPPNPLALGLSRTSLPGRDLSGNPTFAYLNQPIRYSGPTSSDPLTRATEIGRQREIDRLATQQRGLSVAPTLVEAARIRQNYQYNPTAAFGGSQRLSALNLPSSVALPAEIVKKAQGSLESFAIKTFAASAIVDIVGAQFRGMNETTDKLIDAFSKATLAVAGFAFLNKSGGLTAGKLFEGAGGLLGGIGKKSGGSISGISSAIGAISAFGKSLARFLPVIGQIGLAGFVINEFSKVFSDKSIFDRVYQAFGGLSDSAEKAKERFNDVANQLFSAEGDFNPKTREERSGIISSTIKSLALNERARSLGVSAGGSSQETARNIFNRTLSDLLKGTRTGESVTTTGFAPGISPTIKTTTFEKTFADLSQSAIEIIQEQVQNVISGDLEDLRKLAKNNGISISGKAIDEASIDELRKAIGSSLLEGYKASQQFLSKRLGVNASLSSILETNIGQLGFANFAKDFLGGGPAAKTIESGGKAGSKALSPEVQKNIQKIQDEIRSLIFDGTIAALESEIKALEFSASKEGVSDARKNRLLNTASDVQQRIFANQRQQALGNIQARAAEIRSSGKEPEEINAELKKLKVEYANQRLGIKANEQATKRETDERNRAADSLRAFNSSISGIELSISRLAVGRARTEAQLSVAQARAGNPALSIGGQENIQRQAAALQEQIFRDDLTQAAKERDLRIKQAENLSPDKRSEEEEKAKNAFLEQEASINGQIAALNESTKQIGSVKSSFVALDDAILQFTRNLGESRGQNQFNLLQATDANSIVQGLIGEKVYDSSGGKSGAELVSFIADQNALLNEQFKIKTASNASERIELERQLELTTQLLEIKNKNLTPAQKQLEIEQAINANLAKRRTFSSGVKDALAEIETRSQNASNEFGKTATNAFRDGLSDAIKAAANGTGDLKNALLDVALAFANKLRDAAIDNLVDSLMSGGKNGGGSGGLVSSALGLVSGFFQKKATGGMVRGGSGTKDDVPTLLTGGEYVIPKDAVNTYGKTFFDQIRSGTVGKMAQGGYFSPGMRGQGAIVGKENLLDFATQTATSGSQDVRQTLRGGAGLVSLEPESIRSSNWMRFGDSPILQSIREDKDQAFGLYLDQLGQEKQWLQDLEDAKKAEKEKKKAVTRALIMAVVSAAAGSYAKSLETKGSGETAFSGGKIYKTSDINKYGTASSLGRSSSSFSSSISRTSFPSIPQVDLSQVLRNLPTSVSAGDQGGLLLLPSSGYTPYKNSGGYGSGDTKPAMLSNKEFVLNSSASQKLGDKALYALNSGAMPTGQSDDSAIIAKLDELIQKTAESSGSITITVNSSGDSEQASTQSSDASEKNKLIGERLKTAVLQIIRDEKRSGGELSNRR